MRTFSVANQKGGCGKTTTAVNLASAVARTGKRVLLVDNDPQGNATMALGVDSEHFRLTTRDLYLTSDVAVADVRLTIEENLDLVPTDVDLSTVEQELLGGAARLQRLRERLAECGREYDAVFIDNPPSVGMLTFNALLASDEAIVPVDAGRFSLEAVERFSELLLVLLRERGQEVKMRVLPNGFDVRTRHARALLEELAARFPGHLLRSCIHGTVRLREAAEEGKPIDRFDPRSRAALDFEELAQEIFENSAAETRARLSGGSLAHSLAAGTQSNGPRMEEGRVHFALRVPGASKVAVTGDFTAWSFNGVPLRRRDDGTWVVGIPIQAGEYEYRFVVDGEWMPDPGNPETVSNELGDCNSVLRVRAAEA